MQREFFERIWGETEGWAIVGRIHHKENNDDEYMQRAYHYPDNLELLLKDLKSWNKWASVYFYPLITPEGRRDKDHIKQVPLLWIDKDRGAPEDLEPRPTICWQTSSGKCQAFWVLEEPAAPKDAEQANRYLAYKLKGDLGSRDLLHMLRVPGSINHKYSPAQEGVFLWENGPSYRLEQLAPGGGDIEEFREKGIKEAELPGVPEDLPTYSDVITRWGTSVPHAVWDLLNRRPEPDADWSRQLWKIERLLLDAKIPVEDVFVIVRESTWNKYAREKRPQADLWKEVWKAFYDGTSTAEDPESKFEWGTLADLLAYDKKPEWMVDGIWMEEMVGWIAGIGKSFKSILSLDLALSIVSGEPFLGKFKVLNPGPVIMVQEEDPKRRLAHRAKGIAAQKGLTEVKMVGNDFIFPSRPDVPFIYSTGAGFTFNDEKFVEDLEMKIYEIKPRMLILDPWFMMTGGIDEFKSSEVVEVLRALKLWREKYGCAICIIHHNRKGKGDPHEMLYGSHAFYGWSENNMFVSRDKSNNAVSIVRDNKDADQTKMTPISVNFESVGEVYKYTVAESEANRWTGDKVLDFLQKQEIGAVISKDDIAEESGVNERTVRDRLKELHDADRIILRRAGRGGKLVAVTLPALYQAEGVDIDET